jgi:hypothetical protein
VSGMRDGGLTGNGLAEYGGRHRLWALLAFLDFPGLSCD